MLIRPQILPISLLTDASRNRYTNCLSFFLQMRELADGSGVVLHNVEYLALLANRCTKTIRKRLKWLLESGWINSDGNYLFLRSVKRIAADLQGSKRLVRYYPNTDLKAFTFAVIAKQLNRRNKFLKSQTSGSGYTNGSIIPKGCALRYVGSVLSISKSSADNHKRIASGSGLIAVSHRYCKTGISPEDLKHLIRHSRTPGLEPSRFRLSKGIVFERISDLICSDVEFCNRFL